MFRNTDDLLFKMIAFLHDAITVNTIKIIIFMMT